MKNKSALFAPLKKGIYPQQNVIGSYKKSLGTLNKLQDTQSIKR